MASYLPIPPKPALAKTRQNKYLLNAKKPAVAKWNRASFPRGWGESPVAMDTDASPGESGGGVNQKIEGGGVTWPAIKDTWHCGGGGGEDKKKKEKQR